MKVLFLVFSIGGFHTAVSCKQRNSETSSVKSEPGPRTFILTDGESTRLASALGIETPLNAPSRDFVVNEALAFNFKEMVDSATGQRSLGVSLKFNHSAVANGDTAALLSGGFGRLAYGFTRGARVFFEALAKDKVTATDEPFSPDGTLFGNSEIKSITGERLDLRCIKRVHSVANPNSIVNFSCEVLII